jgi:glycine/D-amino acid oxidase-like deaminating enzyme
MSTRVAGGHPHIAVFGAGAFGGWTAHELVRRGARVTLIDAWGPANARASSGGETRVIRTTYGSHDVYTAMAARALVLWREHEARWGRTFLRRTGALWLLGSGPPHDFGRASFDALRARGVAVEWLAPGHAASSYPQIEFRNVASVLFEPDAGYLHARRACEHVVERLIAGGGEYRCGAATAPVPIDGDTKAVALADGDRIAADQFVFACGPWLGTLFPDAIGGLVTPTRQEVYYFGTPAGDDRYSDERMPVWVDFHDRLMYGVPGNANRGFKVADDTPGPAFDPTCGERDVSASGVAAVRKFLAERFPALAGAPLVGSEVCQYEAAADANFIIDRHPQAAHVWIVGGGSGHGFKMGPAVGEIMAACILDGAVPDRQFSLRRFDKRPAGGWRAKWS